MPASPGGMMEAMGSMMGGPPKKQLYPQLMELPAMTPEARARIEADARDRITAGNAALVQAYDDYHRAMLNNDTAAMSAAVTRQRAALAELESGTAGLRALAEGQAPRQIALTWFRDQMNLAPAGMSPEGPVGLFGLTWFHFVSMTAVALFALTLAVMAAGRRRRSIALVNRLTSASAAAPRPSGQPMPAPPPEPSRTAEFTSPPKIAPPKRSTWSGAMRVTAIHRETPHVKTFRLVAPEGAHIPFTFVPGQFLTFTATVDGKTVGRSYSIASPPTRTSYVEITVKREDDGEFSRYLHDRISVGDTLQVRGPSGAFTFDGGNADSIVLIAGGVGITPMMCVIRYLTDMTWPGEIFLVCAVRNTEEFIFREELEYLQRRWPKLHVAAAVAARSEGTAWMGLEGQLSKDAIIHAVPGIDKRRIHLCGPPPMMDAIRRVLAELGVPSDQIKTEAFGPAMGLVPPPRPSPAPPLPVAVTELLQKVETDDVPPGAREAREAEAGPATATLSFARSGKAAPLPPDRTVLEVAEAIGVPIDYSCRVGTCGICKTKLLAGQVTMEVQDALTDEDKASGTILACQARSLGNVTVDA
jgi:ferredoxin-NADP reductase